MYGNEPPDEDRITCPDCGESSYPEIGFGHVCEAGAARAKRETEEWNRRYRGNGEKVRLRIELEIECFNTENALAAAMDGIEAANVFRLANGNGVTRDSVLDFTARFTRTMTVQRGGK